MENCKEALKNKDLEKAIKLAKQSIETNPDNFEGYLYLGIAYYDMGFSKKALEYLKKAEELTSSENDLAVIYRFMGEALIDMKKLDEALTYLNKALSLTKQPNKNMAQVLGKMGDIYYMKKDLLKSAEYYTKAFEIGKEKNLNRESMARITNNLSVILSSLGRYEDAIELFKILLSYGSANNDLFIICLSEINLGSAYFMMGNNDIAKKYFMSGLNHAKEMGNKKLEAITYMYLSDILNDKSYLDKAEKIFKEVNGTNNQLN
jgi:tetratricopeptide (TPR) repeat protein